MFSKEVPCHRYFAMADTHCNLRPGIDHMAFTIQILVKLLG